jgi:hypothetical protein
MTRNSYRPVTSIGAGIVDSPGPSDDHGGAMRSVLRNGILVSVVALAATTAWAQPVKIVGLVELSGTGATAGTNFNNGVARR